MSGALPIPSFTHRRAALRVHVGEHLSDRLVDEVSRIDARRVVVVTGPTTAADPGVANLVAHLGDRVAAPFTGVVGHSPLESVLNLATLLCTSRADCLVTVGGGSALVTARAANIVAHEAGPVELLASRVDSHGRVHSPRLSGPRLPHIAVVTTPTTAAAKAGAAVSVGTERLTFFDPRTRATAVLVDARLCADVPEQVVTSGTLNALTLCVEGLISNHRTAYSTALLSEALHSLLGLVASWPGTVVDPGTRARLVVAATLAGEGTDTTGGGLTSALSHALGVRANGLNGLIDGIVLPHVLASNPDLFNRELRTCSTFAGHPDPVAALTVACRRLQPRTRIGDLGLLVGDIPAVAAASMHDFDLHRNPWPVGIADVTHLLESAW